MVDKVVDRERASRVGGRGGEGTRGGEVSERRVIYGRARRVSRAR